MKVTQSFWLFEIPWTDYTVYGILQARILEWVAFAFSRGSSQPRDQTQPSRIAGGFFTSSATRGAKPAIIFLTLRTGVPNLQNLMPDDLRWSWCNNSGNKRHFKCLMHLTILKPSPHPGPLKNYLPQNRSLVSKRFGTTDLEDLFRGVSDRPMARLRKVIFFAFKLIYCTLLSS